MAARRPAEATGCAPAIAPVTWLHAVAAFSAGEPTWASSLHYNVLQYRCTALSL